MKTILSLIVFLLSLNLNQLVFSQYTDWTYFPRSYMITSFANEGNYLWASSYTGIVKINKTNGIKTFYNKANSPLPTNIVNKILIDHNGIKWFGTQMA